MAKNLYPVVKVRNSGKCQAILFPKEVHIDGEEFYIKSYSSKKIILSRKEVSIKDFFNSDMRCSDDFLEDRIQDLPQVRKEFS